MLPALRTIDLSKNNISRLRGLEQIESLKFLNMSLNNIRKIIVKLMGFNLGENGMSFVKGFGRGYWGYWDLWNSCGTLSY